MWFQQQIHLVPKARGFHLVTKEVEDALTGLSGIQAGLLHLFLSHTSASICINENADPAVRRDMERYFLRAAPDSSDYFEHTCEGPDDMPAHIKSVTIGCELGIPISSGKLGLGTWQGIYLGEHRLRAGPRTLIATVQGTRAQP